MPDATEGGKYVAAAAAYQSREKDERRARATVAEAVPVTGSAAATIVDTELPTGAYQGGETVATELVVRNDGPIENSFYVGYTVVGPDGQEYDAVASTDRTVTLASGASQSLTVSWDVPEDAPPGQYDVVATVWDETDPTDLETELATVTGEAAFGVSTGGLSVLAVESERSAYEPGDLAVVETTVANNGSTTTEYEVVGRFTHLAASEPANRQTQTITLRPGERATLAFEWATTTDIQPGEYDTTIRVREAGTDEIAAEQTVPSAFSLREPNEIVQIDGLKVGPGPYKPADRLALTTRLTSTDEEDDRLLAIEYDVRVDGEWREFHSAQTVLDPGATTALNHDPPVPDYLEAGTYDHRVSVRETGTEGVLYAQTVTENALRVESAGALVVEVRDPSGAPLQAGHVSIEREGVLPKLVGDDGTVRFTDLKGGEVSIVAYPADHPRQTKVIEYEAGTTRRVTFTFGEAASVSGSLSLSDGTALRNVVIEIDGNTARTDENGNFAFDEPLATGTTTAVFRVDGDRIGQRPVLINDRTDSYDFQLQDRNPSIPPSSFARGALCGLGCSVEDASDPSLYTAGWVASGFVAAGDLRDLVVAIDTEQGGEAALAAFGLLPVVGDYTSSAPKIAKLGDVASLAERLEFQRFLGRIDQFEGSRLYLANKLYDSNPTTYLDETLGMQRSSIEELMTEGRDLERISDSAKRLTDEYGFASDRVRQYVKSGRDPADLEDAAQTSRLTDEAADPPRRVDGQTLEDIATQDDLAELTASRRLADANNARIAANLNEISDLEDGRYVIHATDTKGVSAIRSGDIDSMVVSKSGDTVTIERVYEVYAGSNVENAIKKKSQLNNRILPGLHQNADELADDATVEVADDLDGTVYLPEETAKMEYPRAINEGDTVRDSIRRSGYDVRTFDRTSDQFRQDYEALSGAGSTAGRLAGPSPQSLRLEAAD